MANHPFYYSMVLDGHPVHPYQADTLAFTLQRFGDVPPDRIVAHCTNRVSERVREALADRGLEVVPVTPYLDGTYCNKITQLDRFLEAGGRAEGVFLFDLDVAILAPLDVPDRASVWGKIVDDTNPPLDLLERVFRTADVPLPDVLPCDWSPPRGDTLATNFNGGLLYIPLTHVKTLRHTWRQWAEYLFRHEELFEGPAERSHIDQMSFALAVASQYRVPARGERRAARAAIRRAGLADPAFRLRAPDGTPSEGDASKQPGVPSTSTKGAPGPQRARQPPKLCKRQLDPSRIASPTLEGYSFPCRVSKFAKTNRSMSHCADSSAPARKRASCPRFAVASTTRSRRPCASARPPLPSSVT